MSEGSVDLELQEAQKNLAAATELADQFRGMV
jgi:hypothetical protein